VGVPHLYLHDRYPNGAFAGVVMVESTSLIYARIRVALSGADKGLSFVSGDVLDAGSASQLPTDMLDRLLGPDELRKLERMLVSTRPC
jgi:hypothetical protein